MLGCYTETSHAKGPFSDSLNSTQIEAAISKHNLNSDMGSLYLSMTVTLCVTICQTDNQFTYAGLIDSGYTFAYYSILTVI